MANKKEDLKDKLFNTLSSFFASNSANEADEDDEEKEKDVKGNTKAAEGAEGEEEEEDENGKKDNSSKNDEGKITEEEVENKVNSAVQAERARIQAIQNIAGNIDSDLVQEAMFGETACDAGELALRALARTNEKKTDALNKMNKDTEDSKVNEVTNEPPKQTLSENEQREQAVKNLKAKTQKITEGK